MAGDAADELPRLADCLSPERAWDDFGGYRAHAQRFGAGIHWLENGCLKKAKQCFLLQLAQLAPVARAARGAARGSSAECADPHTPARRLEKLISNPYSTELADTLKQSSASPSPLLLHLYSLLALIHLLLLEYQESVFYINLGLGASFGAEYLHFLHARFFIERCAGYIGAASSIQLKRCNELVEGLGAFVASHTTSSSSRVCLNQMGATSKSHAALDDAVVFEYLSQKNIFENKFTLNRILQNTPYRQIRSFRRLYSPAKLADGMGRLKAAYPEHSILSIYCYDGRLWIYDLDRIAAVETDWPAAKREMDEIMERSRQIMQSRPETVAEKREWWAGRIALDRRLGRVIGGIARKISMELKDKIVLVLDETTSWFPFEQVFKKEACRVRSLEVLLDKVSRSKRPAATGRGPKGVHKTADGDRRQFDLIDPEKSTQITVYIRGGEDNTRSADAQQRPDCVHPLDSFYLLDADNNLVSTKAALLQFFSAAFRPRPLGVDGRHLSAREKEQIAKYSLFMYFGHGSGRKHFDLKELRPPSVFLFGCSSSRLVYVPNFAANGSLLSHLNRGRTVLGMLWDVTDRDLDAFTVGFLWDYFKGMSIAGAVRANMSAFKLRYLNGAAVTLYDCP
ncbi:hypothetical protein PAPHI01_1339 [Pancytospora philotis]|nr:hypothetical protein PAPHI01_1339 [Pancytospora philotis]